jgi:hypothetical protein
MTKNQRETNKTQLLLVFGFSGNSIRYEACYGVFHTLGLSSRILGI